MVENTSKSKFQGHGQKRGFVLNMWYTFYEEGGTYVIQRPVHIENNIHGNKQVSSVIFYVVFIRVHVVRISAGAPVIFTAFLVFYNIFSLRISG